MPIPHTSHEMGPKGCHLSTPRGWPSGQGLQLRVYSPLRSQVRNLRYRCYQLLCGQSIQSFPLTLIGTPQVGGDLDSPGLIELHISWAGHLSYKEMLPFI